MCICCLDAPYSLYNCVQGRVQLSFPCTHHRDAGRDDHYWNVTSVIDVTDIAVLLVILLHDGHSPSQKVYFPTDPQGLSPCSQMLSPLLSQMN